MTGEEKRLLEQGAKLAAAKGRAYLQAHPEQRLVFESEYRRRETALKGQGNPSRGDLETYVQQRATALAMMELIATREGPITKKMVREGLGWVPPGWDDNLHPSQTRPPPAIRANAGAARRRGSS